MPLRLLLVLGLCIGSVCLAFGQQDSIQEPPIKKHVVFYNLSNILDLNGSSLQFGFNYRYKPGIDFQLELGLVSDNLLNFRLPFEEYVGYRIRPQIKFLNKKSLLNEGRWYGGLMISYQQLTFKENNNFIIDDSFNQNITYQGKDLTYGWYLIGGVDLKFSRRILVSFSFGLGQLFLKTKINEGDLPENASLLDDCIWFCGRADLRNKEFNRPGVLFDVKIGYMF